MSSAAARPTVCATAAVIERDGTFLITRRKADVPLPGAWEFPGGKLEADESPEACVVREIEEEVGARADVMHLLDVGYYRYPEWNVLLIFYECALTGGEPAPRDCAEVKWIRPEEFPAHEFPPADVAVIETLMKRKGPPR